MEKMYRAWVAVTVAVLVSGCIFFALHFWEAARPYTPFLTGMLSLSIVALIGCLAADVYYASKIGAEPTLADRYQLNQHDYAAVLDEYGAKLLADGYSCLEDIPNTLGCEMRLYFRWEFFDIECFLFLYAPEYTQDMEDEYGTLFWDYLCARHPEAAERDVSLISLVCVEEISPAFESRVNANVQQSLGRFHLPAGVCFSDQTVYIPCQQGGTYRSNYKMMRGQLMQYI